MAQFIIKTMVSAIIIAIVSTLARKYPNLGGLIASLPLTSLLAFIWLYQETQSIQSVSELSIAIFWMILPTLPFFLILPYLLKKYPFYPAFGISIIALMIFYKIFMDVLKYFKIL